MKLLKVLEIKNITGAVADCFCGGVSEFGLTAHSGFHTNDSCKQQCCGIEGAKSWYKSDLLADEQGLCAQTEEKPSEVEIFVAGAIVGATVSEFTIEQAQLVNAGSKARTEVV